MNTKTQHTVLQFDQTIQDDYNQLKVNRQELNAQVRRITGEINLAKETVGGLVASGLNWRDYDVNLNELRADVEAFELGIKHIDGQLAQMKMNNSWLRM